MDIIIIYGMIRCVLWICFTVTMARMNSQLGRERYFLVGAGATFSFNSVVASIFAAGHHVPSALFNAWQITATPAVALMFIGALIAAKRLGLLD